MYQQDYYVPKATGTLSDTLLAFGAATVLRLFVKDHAPRDEVTLRDAGSYYLIDTGVPVQEEWLTEGWHQQIIAFVTSNGKHKVPDDLNLPSFRSVDETRKIFRQELDDRKPPSDWTVVTYLGDNRMQAQLIHNRLIEEWIRTNQQFPGLNIRTILELFASSTADWDAIAGEWKKAVKNSDLKDKVTASQLFNPHMGKGQNRPKANKLTKGDNMKVFWLPEFLKAVGLWTAAVPTKATNVRKTYILAPQEIEMNEHQRIFDRFRDRLWNEGVVKQDIMAVLLYAEVLLQQSIEDDALDVFQGGHISNVVNGMDVATYQLLSANSYTMMNLAFLGLPDWMPICTSDDAYLYVTILEEHREHIRSINENRSEGYALLQLYRDFLSGNYFAPFYEFLAGYSSYLIHHALDRSQFYVKPFSETNLRRLFAMTNPQLSPILEDEGFHNVAYAIRRSTLVPLYRGRRESNFDIRYGLGQALIRKAQYEEDFVQTLSEFMQSYNDETMRVHERTKGKDRKDRRKLITTQDIESVVKLIDKYGSKTVCNLLVAFGYALDPREKSAEELEETEGVVGQ